MNIPLRSKVNTPLLRAVAVAAFLVSSCLGGTGAGANWSGPYSTCGNRNELLKYGHMNLGVKFDTSSPVIAGAFHRALAFWSTILDISYYEENSGDCALALVDATPEVLHEANNVARAQFTDLANFQGWVAFDPHISEYMTEGEIYATAIHELGHLFGLRHNPHANSIMYYLDCDTSSVLDELDLEALSQRHKLRISRRTAIPVLDTQGTD